MAEKYIKGTGKGRGGWRGGGRPKSNKNCVFYVKCTEQEKIILKEYLENLRKGT